MTGFGVGRATVDGTELTVEVRSVNHKFCEVKVRLPRELSSLEPAIVKQVKDRLARGAIEVSVKPQGRTATGNLPTLDVPLARAYHEAFQRLGRELGLSDKVSLRDIGFLTGVVRLEEPQLDLERSAQALISALTQALEALTRMREAEGKALLADLEARLAVVEQEVQEIQAQVPRALEEYRKRLADRVQELAGGLSVDPQRLAQEVAFFAERTDVAEEMTRLTSHVEQFRKLLASTEPAGRKMDFLIQEMHREVNTTGSKSQHTGISQRVLSLKAELERIREQVQNVE